MMWKLFFFLIVTVAASDYDEEESPGCRRIIFHECEAGVGPPDFPGSEEELEEFCKFVSNYFECTAKLIDQCDQGNENEAAFLQTLQEVNTVFNHVCDKDALLYSALAASVHCIKNKGRQISGHCRSTMEGLQTFSEILSSSGISDVELSDDEEASGICMAALYTSSCSASRIGKFCGNVARDAALEFILGFDSPFATCRPGVKDNIPTIAQVMQVEAEKEENVENIIKKRRK